VLKATQDPDTLSFSQKIAPIPLSRQRRRYTREVSMRKSSVIVLLLFILCVARADAGKSPLGHISQKCDNAKEMYLEGPTDHGIDVTLFVTNSSATACDMNIYAWCEFEEGKPPRECQEASGPAAIHPGQTRSFTMKRFRFMTVRCGETDGGPQCVGTFQLWR
jgi:hypothetical protein